MIKNFKARCIKNTTYATENKIYEFINGITIKGGKPTPLGVRWIA